MEFGTSSPEFGSGVVEEGDEAFRIGHVNGDRKDFQQVGIEPHMPPAPQRELIRQIPKSSMSALIALKILFPAQFRPPA
jgi:hypothetical protein